MRRGIRLVLAATVVSASFIFQGTARAQFVTHNTWSSGLAMPTPRFGSAFGVIKGKIYVVSGATHTAVVDDNEIYDPVSNTWTTGAHIPTARYVPASAVVKNILYVIGGCNSGCGNGIGALTVVEAYNPATDSWSTKTPLPTPTDSVYAIASKGIIYVIGGYVQGSGRVTTVYAYNPKKDTWTLKKPMSVGKSNAALGVLGGIIAAGGLGNGGDVPDDEIFNTAKNKWKNLAPIPTARAGACYGVISGKFYVAGGSTDASNSVDVMESYSGSKKSWATKASMPQAVTVPVSGVVKGRLYCIGGGDNGNLSVGMPFENVQIYQP